MENSINNMKALIILTNAGFTDDVMEIARNAGIGGATILNARGESARHESILGITVDSEKEMLFCVTSESVATKAMAALKEKAGIGTPAHCVCFTMPVEKVIGIDTAASQPVKQNN